MILPFTAAFGAAVLSLAAASAEPHPEQSLMAALERWEAGRSQEALDELSGLVRREPTFRLAQLLYGDMLAAYSGGSLLPRPAASDPRIADLVEEARLRLDAWRGTPAAGLQPDALVQMAPSIRHAVVADLAHARLYLLEHREGDFRLLRSYYAGIGKAGTRKKVSGDNRTPIGIYQITGWLDDKELPELYGSGAFPLDYPNVWDRHRRKTGSGIWLHGVPRDLYTRPPRSSEGCVTLANADLLSLKPYLVPGHTPVVLSDALQWLPDAAAQAQREEFLQVLENWRARWSALDTDGYLAFYAADFTADGMNRKTFSEYKRRVNAGKKYVEVKLRDVEVFRYPAEEPLTLVRFTQDYRSDNLARTTQKEQFWRQEKAGWRIVKEENR